MKKIVSKTVITSGGTVTITTNGETRVFSLGGGGNNISVDSANGSTTVSINGNTISVNGNGVNINGHNVVQSIGSGTNSTIYVNGVKVSGNSQGTIPAPSRPNVARKTPRAPSAPITPNPQPKPTSSTIYPNNSNATSPVLLATPTSENKTTPLPKRRGSIYIETVDKVRKGFAELEMIEEQIGRKIDNIIVRRLYNCKGVMKEAKKAERDFMKLKEKMSSQEYPYYLVEKKPKTMTDTLKDENGVKINSPYAILDMQGTTYEGEIGNARLNGLGSIISPKGSRYAGYFLNNKDAGYGVYHEPDGRVIMANRLSAIVMYNDRVIAMGNAKGKKLEGYGFEIDENNQIRAGVFKNGKWYKNC